MIALTVSLDDIGGFLSLMQAGVRSASPQNFDEALRIYASFRDLAHASAQRAAATNPPE
jgi:hypothetical protein